MRKKQGWDWSWQCVGGWWWWLDSVGDWFNCSTNRYFRPKTNKDENHPPSKRRIVFQTYICWGSMLVFRWCRFIAWTSTPPISPNTHTSCLEFNDCGTSHSKICLASKQNWIKHWHMNNRSSLEQRLTCGWRSLFTHVHVFLSLWVYEFMIL